MICSGLVHTVMWPFSGIRGVLEPVLAHMWSFVRVWWPAAADAEHPAHNEYLIHLTALFCFILTCLAGHPPRLPFFVHHGQGCVSSP